MHGMLRVQSLLCSAAQSQLPATKPNDSSRLVYLRKFSRHGHVLSTAPRRATGSVFQHVCRPAGTGSRPSARNPGGSASRLASPARCLHSAVNRHARRPAARLVPSFADWPPCVSDSTPPSKDAIQLLKRLAIRPQASAVAARDGLVPCPKSTKSAALLVPRCQGEEARAARGIAIQENPR